MAKETAAKPKKKTAKKQPAKPAAAKPTPKAAVAFREVRFAQDLVGLKVALMPLSLKGEKDSLQAKVVNVDLNAGVYILKVRGKQGTFVYPMDQAAIQVV